MDIFLKIALKLDPAYDGPTLQSFTCLSNMSQVNSLLYKKFIFYIHHPESIEIGWSLNLNK